ncbi:hypothetical protein BGW42_000916 [Actinomortierella wolfii]|nr:hypothetical protein BGW42_000916 [Actinomortierella wolfii]
MSTSCVASSNNPSSTSNPAPRVRERLAPSSSSLYQQPHFFRGSSAVLGRSGSSAHISSAGVPSSSPVAQAASASTSSLPSQRRTRSTSQPPPPPKYRTYRTPQLRISLQDGHGNLVLSPPVMAPGESIRGQIHLELPKPTPVHSIEVSLTGTVSAYDGARLGVMKSEIILEEIKTVATASMTNARTNTTRRHTAPAAPPTAPSSRSAVTTGAAVSSSSSSSSMVDTSTRDHRRSSMTNMASSGASRSSTIAGNSNSSQIGQRTSATSELMSRTLSMPSSYYTHGLNASTLSLSRPVSPTMQDIRGRRTSFSANVDTTGSAPGSYPGLGSGFHLYGRNNMSAVNISTISQWGDSTFDDNTPAYAPSYDSPNFEHLFASSWTSTGAAAAAAAAASSSSSSSSAPRNSDEINAGTETIATSSSASSIPEEEESETSSSSNTGSASSASSASTTATSVSTASSSPSRRSVSRPMTRSDSSSGTSRSTSSSRGGTSSSTSVTATDASAGATTTAATTTTTITTTTTTAEPEREPAPVIPEPEPEPEPKAVLMQPGNYVIPFSIRIPSNAVMSLPGSFSDPVGSISYQLKAIMKQIIPPSNDGPRSPPKPARVESTYTSAPQVIKLMPMNDPQRMPFYMVPYETPTLRAGVGHWVWSTGFIEARAWIPKQCYRPGRMVPLVIYIVNQSDARQIIVETTLCKCLHYGSGLTKLREMVEQGMLTNALDWDAGFQEDETGHPDPSPSQPIHNTLPSPPSEPSSRWGRPRLSLLRSPSRSSRNRQRSAQDTMPSPPGSPGANDFSTTTPSSDQSRSPEGSLYGYSSSTMPASPSMGSTSIGSLSSQLEALASSPPASSSLTAKPLTTTLLPQVQHQREKLIKLRATIGCHQAIDREIQKTLMVPIPATAGYSILNAPLLEVSYEIVVKIRVDKVYSRGIRLEVPIVVVVPEEGDVEEEEGLMLDAGVDYQAMLSMTDLHGGGVGGGGGSFANGARGRSGTGTIGDSTVSFETHARFGFGFDDDYGECPPYEPPPVSSGRRRSRR